MKKILLSVFILLSLSQAKASDTLPIRQVFNFNVGDTFDHVSYQTASGAPSLIYWHSYYRLIVTQKFSYTTSDSIGYVLYYIDNSSSSPNDTVIYTNPDSPSTILYFTDTLCTKSMSIGTSIWDSSFNLLTQGCFELLSNKRYEKGLGLTYSLTRDMGNFTDTYDSLLYYSKGNTHTGTTYYNQPNGINDISNSSNIIVYPNPTSDQLHLSFIDARSYNAQFIITDILGQEVYSSPVSQSETTYDISRLSAGIYTWRIVEDNAIIKTGKVVKE